MWRRLELFDVGDMIPSYVSQVTFGDLRFQKIHIITCFVILLCYANFLLHMVLCVLVLLYFGLKFIVVYKFVSYFKLLKTWVQLGFVVYKLSLFKHYVCSMFNMGFCCSTCHGNVFCFIVFLVLFDVIITLFRELNPNWAWAPKMWKCCVMGGVKKTTTQHNTRKVLPTKKAPPFILFIYFCHSFPFYLMLHWWKNT